MSSTLNPVAFAMRLAAVSFLVRPPLTTAHRPPRDCACSGVVPSKRDAVDGHQRKADAQVDVLVPLTLPSHNERPGTDEFAGLCGLGDLGRFDGIHRAVTATAAPCAAPTQGQLCTLLHVGLCDGAGLDPVAQPKRRHAFGQVGRRPFIDHEATLGLHGA